MNILLTRKCFNELKNKLDEYRFVLQPQASKNIEECRPIGCLEDNPEYISAMEEQYKINQRIIELQNILNSSTIFNESMIVENTVSFGSTITIKNTDTNDEKTFTIVSIYDSDIKNGLISIEAPIIKSSLGLHTGDYFDFNDNTFEIISISYSSQLC